ncbi:hypothetical protein F5Y19DRAFT_482041 [Xylariaceae sp. FL1651]|nr:hypothetical protein F5Y19DRAFT_482041 [Xylariaceae sp. FL1651]
MDSTNGNVVNPGPAQSNSTTADCIADCVPKRKLSEVEDANLSPTIKRAQLGRPVTRSQTRAAASNAATDSNDAADGDGAPGPPSPTLSAEEQTSHKPLPLPAGDPPVSADFRSAMCDSISYWKQHQGGIQSNDKVASGMLLNGKTTPRDVLSHQVVITSVGGGLRPGVNNKHVRIEDQRDNCLNYVVLKNARDKKAPIGIVLGKKADDSKKANGADKQDRYVNDLVSVHLEHQFNVLDWFHITEIWPEYQPTQSNGTQYKQYMVRLEKIDLESPSWWVPQGVDQNELYAAGQYNCRVFICQFCRSPSKEIFQEGWCCLDKSCAEFFRFTDPSVNIDDIHYHENFLKERNPWARKGTVQPLVPSFPAMSENQFGSEEKFKGGIVCPTCKFASRRKKWDGWYCEKGCGFELVMTPKDVPMHIIQEETSRMLRRHTKYFEIDERIDRFTHNVNGYNATTFYLPNAPGSVHEGDFLGTVTVFRPTQLTLQRPGGLDDLFRGIQEATRVGDVQLERRPARCRGSHMEELTSHFSSNIGADYKFGVVVETSQGFDKAPAPVMQALGRLTWAGAAAVNVAAENVDEHELFVDAASMPAYFTDFNEQLILGYFERSQISYHDDGERELGPTVATLSLGSPSIMRFRRKKNSGIHTTGTTGTLLSFVLEHGDMVVMHGTKIHQHYEHAVFSGGIRRYALTCRYIRPEMIRDSERREKAIANGTIPTYWQNKAYQGEVTQDPIQDDIKKTTSKNAENHAVAILNGTEEAKPHILDSTTAAILSDEEEAVHHSPDDNPPNSESHHADNEMTEIMDTSIATTSDDSAIDITDASMATATDDNGINNTNANIKDIGMTNMVYHNDIDNIDVTMFTTTVDGGINTIDTSIGTTAVDSGIENTDAIDTDISMGTTAVDSDIDNTDARMITTASGSAGFQFHTSPLGLEHRIPYHSHDRLMNSIQETINTIQANEGILDELNPATMVNIRILGSLLARNFSA